MIDYRAGDWGFHVAFGLHGSLAPRALAMAIPNAIITFIVGSWLIDYDDYKEEVSDAAQLVIGAGTTVMGFILYNRSRTSYSRWWEGGTLLQKARGEWFNAYSSIMAFTSTKPELADQVDEYIHMTARLMSLLMCCALQQVSPNRDRPFEIIDLEGIEPGSMEFLNTAPDKVEIILQWIQRSMVLHMQTGVLPVAPPVLSRAFQEVSRGIVNLQNARKIADFPYPFPLAQISMILQLLHWISMPFAASLAMSKEWAVIFVFTSIFVLWCIHFNALDLEFPFGTRVNDLPMNEFQQDWNKSICTLLQRRAQRPPKFEYNPFMHNELNVAMSDASALYAPTLNKKSNRSTASQIITMVSGERKTSITARYSIPQSPVTKGQILDPGKQVADNKKKMPEPERASSSHSLTPRHSCATVMSSELSEETFNISSSAVTELGVIAEESDVFEGAAGYLRDVRSGGVERTSLCSLNNTGQIIFSQASSASSSERITEQLGTDPLILGARAMSKDSYHGATSESI